MLVRISVRFDTFSLKSAAVATHSGVGSFFLDQVLD